MGFFGPSKTSNDVTAREAQAILCRFLRVHAEQIAADVQRGGARAVLALAAHLEAGNIQRAR